MLVMSRRQGEAILIHGDIEIHILSVGRSKVRIGIKAPREVPVVAREIELVQKENAEAAATHSSEVLSAAIAGILDIANDRSSR